eukprot:816859-Pyramimonas_sp.AAC.1
MNRAQSRAVASSLADFKQWVSDRDGTGALFKAAEDAPLPTLELDSTDGMIYQPMDVIDKKAQHWHKLWT